MFFIGGCDTKYEDLVELVDTINEKSNLEFKEFKIKGLYQVNEKISNYELIRDKQNYFLKVNNDYAHVIKGNGLYRIYSSVDNDKIYYESYDEINEILDSFFANVDINVSINDTYINISNHLRNYFNRCQANDKIVTCNVEKKIFNKYDIEIQIKGNDNKRVNAYLIKRGKISSIVSEYNSPNLHLKTILEYDYGNQKIKEFNKSEYKRKSS